MGGAQAGEVASGLAAETLAREVAAGAPLRQAAKAANAAVFARANDNIEQTGMGTTLTALLLEGDEGRFAHVGDSRAYLLRGGELQQLTDDHSLVGEMVREGRLTPGEAAVHPHRSILSRALGTEPHVRIDELVVALAPDDVLLLCSDGLCGVVTDEDIRKQLARPDPAEAARKLIQLARKRGGPDNITAVVLRLDEAPEQAAGEGEEEPAQAELHELEAETAAVAGEVDAHAGSGGGGRRHRRRPPPACRRRARARPGAPLRAAPRAGRGRAGAGRAGGPERRRGDEPVLLRRRGRRPPDGVQRVARVHRPAGSQRALSP